MSETTGCRRCGGPLGADGACPRCLFEASGRSASQPPPAPRTPPGLAELQPHFTNMELLACLGSGGMGAVYRARQIALGREVALKILHPGIADAQGVAERFDREARALAGLRHPGIVTVFEVGRAGPWTYIAMELVDGVDLRSLVRGRELAPRDALSIVVQICEALQYAHDKGVVHRDIKPENILVDVHGRVRILDFGLAKIVGAPETQLTAPHQVMGTVHYMAPEQWERPLAVDHRADIFSLGVVFYELLTGELPVGRFQPPSQRVEVSVRLDEIVLRALEREPERRYQRASEVRDEVEPLRGTAAAGGKASRSSQRTNPGLRRIESRIRAARARGRRMSDASAAAGLPPARRPTLRSWLYGEDVPREGAGGCLWVAIIAAVASAAITLVYLLLVLGRDLF